jgi:hypothetical protein
MNLVLDSMKKNLEQASKTLNIMLNSSVDPVRNRQHRDLICVADERIKISILTVEGLMLDEKEGE